MFTGNQRLTHTISTLLNVGTNGVEQRTPTNRRTLENIIRRQTDTIRPRPKPPSSPVNLPTPRDILSLTETVTRVTRVPPRFSSLSAEYGTLSASRTHSHSIRVSSTSGHTCPRRSSDHSFALNSDGIGTSFTFAYHWNDIVPGAEHHSISSTRTMHEAHTVRRKRSRRCRVAPSIFFRHYRPASRHSRRGMFAHSRVFRRSNHVDVTKLRNCTERERVCTDVGRRQRSRYVSTTRK